MIIICRFLLFGVLLWNTCDVFSQIPDADSLALVDLYSATDGANWTNNSNWLQAPIKNWYGVTTTASRIIIIDLSNNNLTGEIPESIIKLRHLIRLTLPHNNLSGVVPHSEDAFPALTTLDLQYNNLSGRIPPQSQSSNLKNIYLNDNNFEEGIHPSIANLETLVVLWIQGNKLTKLPDLTGIPRLSQLRVENNALEFDDLEINLTAPDSIITYYPQAVVGRPASILLDEDESLRVSAIVAGDNNQYQWYLNGSAIPGATNADYSINRVDTDLDAGEYHCEIQNANVPDLILEYAPVLVSINSGDKVELARFTGVASDTSITLLWETSLENDTDRFILEENVAQDWISIGTFSAAGVAASYDTTFIRPKENYRFRLRIINGDGTTLISSSIELNITIPEFYVLDGNYPNPFRGQTRIGFYMPVVSHVRIEIYNILGKRIDTMVDREVSVGRHFINYNAENLGSGVYFYRMIVIDEVNKQPFVQTRKFQVIH